MLPDLLSEITPIRGPDRYLFTRDSAVYTLFCKSVFLIKNGMEMFPDVGQIWPHPFIYAQPTAVYQSIDYLAIFLMMPIYVVSRVFC